MRRAIYLVVSFLLAIIIVIVYSLQNQDTKMTLTFKDSPHLEDLTVKHQKDGIVKWLVTSKRATLADTANSNIIILEDLKITFPERDFIVFSKRGIYNLAEQSLKIEGDVNAQTRNYTINASNLFWDPKEGVISSDEKIAIIGKDFYIEGDELSASPKIAILKRNVKAIFR